MKLLLGSHNKGKRIEWVAALSQLPITLVTPEEIGIQDPPAETEDTYEGNAIAKAKFYRERSGGLPTLSEDAGIVVEALGDQLGVKTHRWGAGEHATDEEWVSHFLKRMESEENRRARFMCVMAFIDDADEVHLFHGDFPGVITQTLEGPYPPGLPTSGCFKPDGSDIVFGAMPVDEKNRQSHRGQALGQVCDYIEQNLLAGS